MSFRKKIIETVAGKRAEDRAYRRFKAGLEPLIFAEAVDRHRLRVEDLSFGGIAVRADAGSEAAMAAATSLTVQVLDQKLQFKVELVRANGPVVAYQFPNHALESVVALHSVLRGLETGSDLGPAQPRASAVGDQLVINLRSDRGCNLSIEGSAKGDAVKLHLSFTDEGRDCDLKIDGGRIILARSNATGQSGGIDTGKHEKLVLRHAVFIFMAIESEPVKRMLIGPLNLCLRDLGLVISVTNKAS